MTSVLSVPAGRAFRRGESKWVDADAEKGSIEIRFEDDLTHFSWRSRVSGNLEEDLIIFPGEASFQQVEQDPSGRMHILKFSSSDQKHFFWFQRLSAESDLRSQVDIDALLQDPSYRPGTAALPATTSAPGPASSGSGVPSTPLPSQAQQERSWPPTPGAPRLSHPEPAPRAGSSLTGSAGGVAATPTPAAASGGASMDIDQATDQNAGQSEIARLVAEWAQQGGLGRVEDDARLTDVLSPANISTLLSTRPELASTLAPLLPSGLSLPSNPTSGDLLPILTAPQFTDAIASLDSALRNGGLPGGILRDLGLPESAGNSVKAFLDALVGLNRSGTEQSNDERMDED